MTRSPHPVARPISRRPVLVGLTTAMALPGMAGSLTGCADKAPDPLIKLVNQAYSDAALVDAAVHAWQTASDQPSDPSTGDLLKELGRARRTHAERMAEELGDDAPQAPAAGQPTPAQDPRAVLATVLTALDAAQSSARNVVLIPGLKRDRAALVGSVAACCAAYGSVLR